MSKPRIYADFHNLDDFNRLRLTCAGTRDDLGRHGIELREGLALTFYTDDADDQGRPDDLLLDGVVHFHETEKCWVAAVNWAALRHISEQEDRGLDSRSASNSDGLTGFLGQGVNHPASFGSGTTSQIPK